MPAGRGLFKTLLKIYDGTFCEISWRLKELLFSQKNLFLKTSLRVAFLHLYGIIEVLLNITKGRCFPITIVGNINRPLTITSFHKRQEYRILSPLITLCWLASWIIWRPRGRGIFRLCLIPKGFLVSFLMRPLYIPT